MLSVQHDELSQNESPCTHHPDQETEPLCGVPHQVPRHRHPGHQDHLTCITPLTLPV